MKIRFAFVGFRHGHIFDVLKRVNEHAETELVAACEEHDETRQQLLEQKKVSITHDDYEKMLAETDCHAVAVGDTYGRRGPIIIRALQAGKHVISDKPICCTLEQLQQIRQLSQQSNLVVGCQLDLRSDGAVRAARQAIGEGQIGQVHTITFLGQHPLLLGVRPGWYFEPGQHGGTINDIAVHAVDAMGYVANRHPVQVVAARVWNAKTGDYPHFQDCAQVMFRLDNDGGALGDVSYLAPDGAGYKMPNYWRFTIHGSGGVVEFSLGDQRVLVTRHEDRQVRYIPAAPRADGEYFQDFLYQVKGQADRASLTTADVFRATHVCLAAQKAAEERKTNVSCRYS